MIAQPPNAVKAFGHRWQFNETDATLWAGRFVKLNRRVLLDEAVARWRAGTAPHARKEPAKRKRRPHSGGLYSGLLPILALHHQPVRRPDSIVDHYKSLGVRVPAKLAPHGDYTSFGIFTNARCAALEGATPEAVKKALARCDFAHAATTGRLDGRGGRVTHCRVAKRCFAQDDWVQFDAAMAYSGTWALLPDSAQHLWLWLKARDPVHSEADLGDYLRDQGDEPERAIRAKREARAFTVSLAARGTGMDRRVLREAWRVLTQPIPQRDGSSKPLVAGGVLEDGRRWGYCTYAYRQPAWTFEQLNDPVKRRALRSQLWGRGTETEATDGAKKGVVIGTHSPGHRDAFTWASGRFGVVIGTH